MLEVPTDEVRDGVSHRNGDLPGIVQAFGRNHLLLHVTRGQFVGLVCQRQQGRRVERLVKECAHAFGRALQLGFDEDGGTEKIMSGQINGSWDFSVKSALRLFHGLTLRLRVFTLRTMLIPRLCLRRAARSLSRGGFTLVELLVVIGIIAILAGVALGPITNGIKKAKQSSGLQSAHAIGLAMYSCANDNSQTYPDSSGGDASNIAKTLLAGGYVTDPSIFYISGGTATKYTGSAPLTAAFAQANVSWDFAGNNGAGLSSITYPFLPIMWSSVAGSGTEPTFSGLGTAGTAATCVPGTGNPFQTAGIAVFYINNSAAFVTSTLVGGTPTVTIINGSTNTGGPATAPTVLQGGG